MSARKELLVTISSKVFIAFTLVLSIKISTTYLSHDEYAIFMLVSSLSTFASLLLLNPVSQYINANINLWNNRGLLILVIKKFILYAMVVALAASVLVSLWGITKNFSYLYTIFLIFNIFFFTFFMAINANFVYFLNMLGYRYASAGCAAVSFVSGLLLAACFLLFSPTSNSWIFGQMLGAMIGSSIGGFLLFKRVSNFGNNFKSLINSKSFHNYLLPLAFATCLMWIVFSSYKLLIESFWNFKILAIISVPFFLAAQVWAFYESIAINFWFPLFHRKIQNSTSEDKIVALSDLINIIIPTYLILLGCTFVGSKFFFSLIVADAYADHWKILFIGFVFEFFRSCTNVFSIASQINLNPGMLRKPYILGSIALLILMTLCLSLNLGVNYIATSIALASVLVLVAMFFQVNNFYKFKVDYYRWFTSINIAVIGALVGVLLHTSVMSSTVCMLIEFTFLSFGAFMIKYIQKRDVSIHRLLNSV